MHARVHVSVVCACGGGVGARQRGGGGGVDSWVGGCSHTRVVCIKTNLLAFLELVDLYSLKVLKDRIYNYGKLFFVISIFSKL